MKEILGSHAVDVNYESVEIVRRRGSYLKYSSGNYQTDISLARIDGAILDHLQEHYSVMDDEKLVAGKTGTMTLADNQRRSNSAVIPLISPLEQLLQISQLPCAISVCP